MKKIFLMSLMLTVFGSAFFTSCCTDGDVQIMIQEELVSDNEFVNAVEATVEMVVTAVDNQWLDNADAISELARKASDSELTVAQQAQLEGLLGMTMDDYTREMTDFGNAWNVLLEKYPQLNEMSDVERQAIFADAVAGNEDLMIYLADVQSMLRACFWQDLCNLVVDLAALIGGPFLCEVIANAVPVIGPLLCNIVLDIASDLLTGLCGLIPC
ncbi:MAG: hypothetical protein GY751_18335 [Bacteroidetes bacterium]|nr:hypothetical protein [Bacteroidota bacterium]